MKGIKVLIIKIRGSRIKQSVKKVLSEEVTFKRWHQKKKRTWKRKKKKNNNPEIVVILELWGRMGDWWRQCWSRRMGYIIQQGHWFLTKVPLEGTDIMDTSFIFLPYSFSWNFHLYYFSLCNETNQWENIFFFDIPHLNTTFTHCDTFFLMLVKY